MPYKTNYDLVIKSFNPKLWKTVMEYEQFILEFLAETRFDVNQYTHQDGTIVEYQPVNHFPVLKKYEVWMEGFTTNVKSQGAMFLGSVDARNFAQACHMVLCRDFLVNNMNQNKKNFKGEVKPGVWDYDPVKFTFWGCQLYWSESLAKKTFG